MAGFCFVDVYITLENPLISHVDSRKLLHRGRHTSMDTVLSNVGMIWFRPVKVFFFHLEHVGNGH